MISKEWKLKLQPEEAVLALCRELEILPLTARLLYNRGYQDTRKAEAFIRRETGVFYDPFLMRDMDRAAERIRRAVDSGEKITIFGDYDADGVTSTTILYLYLKEQGASVFYYIPDRLKEGYGLNPEAVRRIADDGTRLIVTVDTGITAIREAELIETLGMELVVTDHHACRPELPVCCAVVNPHRPDCSYPFEDLAGVGVAFKLICALETMGMTETAEKMKAVRRLCVQYLEYTAIGTIADVMPLRDENRLIVTLGLALMQETAKPGLLALLQHAGSGAETKSKYPPKKRKITSSLIGFTVAPRINAAGRIASASRAAELFLTEDPETADQIAEELCQVNRRRQEIENQIAEEAFAQAEAMGDLSDTYMLVLAGENWHPGVIGIVASRVTEKYNLPSILISFDADGNGKGSGRSIPGFHLADGLAACDDLLVRYGGHAQAAGLSIRREQLEAFRDRIGRCAKEAFGGEIPPPVLDIDCRTVFSDISLRTAEELSQLEPFGTDNPAPVFMLQNAVIRQVNALSGGKHTRLQLGDPADAASTRTALLFGVPTDTLPFAEGDCVDVVYQMEINEFQGQQSVQMMVEDLRYHGSAPSQLFLQKQLYKKCCAGIPILTPGCETPADMVPSRALCGTIYRMLRAAMKNGAQEAPVSYVQTASRAGCSYMQVRLVFDIFEQAHLLLIRNRTEDGITASLPPSDGKKADLTETPLMKQLVRMYGTKDPRV